GRIAKIQVAALAPTWYAYDARGRVTLVARGNDPTCGDPSVSMPTDCRRNILTYDSSSTATAGYLQQMKNPLAEITTISSDALGRMTSLDLPATTGTRTLGQSYDANGNVLATTPPSRPS